MAKKKQEKEPDWEPRNLEEKEELENLDIFFNNLYNVRKPSQIDDYEQNNDSEEDRRD